MAEEFAGRDAKGLIPEEKSKQNEAQARAFYFKMKGGICLFLAPIIAVCAAGLATWLSPHHAAQVAAKLDFVRTHDLGYVYLAWCLAFAARSYATISANGARAPARVDRPDQHVFQVMAESGPLANAPYVLMTTTGAIGRFNRAQRACANLDESIALFISGLVLQGLIYGPLAVAVAAIYVYGAVRFSEDYKDAPGKRSRGFLYLIIAYHVVEGFMVVIVFQTLVRPLLPMFGL